MKKVKLLLATAILSAVMCMTTFAGQWKSDSTGWWYQNDDGNYPVNCWQEIDGKQYYFGSDGYMLANTKTPDGYLVGADGAWITENATATTGENKYTPNEDGSYSLGKTWKVDGLWEFTFNSVTETYDRNEYSEKDPEQVVILNYTYKNLGYEKDFMDLYISDGNMKIMDQDGNMASSYPLSVKKYPQETPIGGVCKNAEVVIGLDSESAQMTVIVEKYDNSYNEHSARFVLPIE